MLSKENRTENMSECRFFLMGSCKFGSRCHFQHTTTTTSHCQNAVSVVQLPQNDTKETTTPSNSEDPNEETEVDLDIVLDRQGESVAQLHAEKEDTQHFPSSSVSKRHHAMLDVGTEVMVNSETLCVFFQQGYCRKGLHCRFRHFEKETLSNWVVNHNDTATDDPSNTANHILLKYSTSKKPRRDYGPRNPQQTHGQTNPNLGDT
jgi:hypothetical protein